MWRRSCYGVVKMATPHRRNVLGVCTIIGGILIHLTLGNLYSFGNMMTYMVSYMHQRVDPSVTYANFIWVMSITTMAQGLFMVLGGLMEKRAGPRLTCLLGCSILSAGIMVTHYTVEVSLLAVTLTYGLMAGLGISLAYVSPLACGMKWFPGHKGLVNGLIVGGFGMGSLGSTTLQTVYLNPDNLSPQPDGFFVESSILDRVPSLFLVLGGVFLVLQITGCLMISFPTQNRVTHHWQEQESLLAGQVTHDEEELAAPPSASITTSTSTTTAAASHDSEAAPAEVRDLSPLEIFKERTFYVLWLTYFINTIGIGYINAMGKSFGQTFIQDDHFLAIVVSMAAVFNAGGRVVWGRIMDKTSFVVAMRFLSGVFALLFATLPLTAWMGKAGFTLWIWAIFFTFSGTFVLLPTATEKAFGSEHYSANYGLLFTSQTLSGPLIAVGNQMLLGVLGYTGCFLIVAAVLLISMFMTFLLPRSI